MTPRRRRWFTRRKGENEPKHIVQYTNALQDMYYFVKDVEEDVEEKLKKQLEKEKEKEKQITAPKGPMYNQAQLVALTLVWGLISGFLMYYFVLSNLVPGK